MGPTAHRQLVEVMMAIDRMDKRILFGNEFLDEIIEFIAQNYLPEAIFDDDALDDWARGNDYILIEEAEDYVDF